MQSEGMLINHKQSPLFCSNKWSWMKTATLRSAGSPPEPLRLSGDHPLTHQCHYKSLARRGFGTNSEVSGKCSRSIIAYYLNSLFASSEFFRHLYSVAQPWSYLWCLVSFSLSCQVCRGGTMLDSLLFSWKPKYKVIVFFVDWLMMNRYYIY